MSDSVIRGRVDRFRPNRFRHVVAPAAGVLATGLVCLLATVVGAEPVPVTAGRVPVVGRTSSVCTVSPEKSTAETTVSAVGIQKAPGREGVLQAKQLGEEAEKPELEISEQGQGNSLTDPKLPVILQGEGVMATGSAGSVVSVGNQGPDTGISYAPCTAPATEQWFVGIGASERLRSELVLTNTDESQAEVDLRFYGENGLVVVPGSPAVVIPAQTTNRLSLDALVQVEGPLTVQVSASRGRVAAMTRDFSITKRGNPKGVDWHQSSVTPSTEVVIPGVPGGAGQRQLTVVNPSDQRTTVKVEVIDVQSTFQPTGADSIELEPESSATVELSEAVAGQPVAVRLSSTTPITGAVMSHHERDKSTTDIAVQPAAAPIVMTGVAATAAIKDTDGSVMLTNTGDENVNVAMQVLNYDGTSIREDTVVIAPDTTETRKLGNFSPSYLVLRAPTGSEVYAGVAFDQPEGDVAGLTSAVPVSTDLASRAPDTVNDPSVGRN